MLRKLSLCDDELMLQCILDPLVNNSLRINPDLVTIDSVRDFILKSQHSDTNIHFAIVNSQDKYMGTISLKNIDLGSYTAEYAIAIGSVHHCHGVGTTSTIELLNYAFNELNLNKVYLNVLSSNSKAISLYEKIGFKLEGEFKEHMFIKGRLENLKWYAIFKQDFI